MDTVRQDRIILSGNKKIKPNLKKVDRLVYSKALRNSIITAVLMVMYIFAVQTYNTPESASYLKPVSYLIMFSSFYLTLKSYKKSLPKGKIFFKGALLGLYMSAITAGVLVSLMTILQVVFQEGHFSKFTREIDTFAEMVTFDWILFFQTFVFGIIINFIVLQGIKDTNKTK